MSDYNWCHNPKCHTYHTTDRIRGVKGKKVLRTRKIKVRDYSQAYYWQGWENHFCRVACFFEFVKQHITSIIAIAPVNQASETPIDVVVETEILTDINGTMGNMNEYLTLKKQKIKPIENNQ